MRCHSILLTVTLAMGTVLIHPSAGAAQSSRQNNDAQKLFDDGRDLFDDGRYPEAEKKFREALTRYPKADKADRTAYYLIDTLIRLRRLQEARAEIEKFHRTYPASRWRLDVDERNVALGGSDPYELMQQETKIARERAEAERRGSPALPPDASWEAELLRRIIQMDPNAGIEKVKDRLKVDPSDPVVAANLGTIFSSNSPQALPFLLSLWRNPAASPNVQNTAFFFAMRRNPDKAQVARTLMDMLTQPENEPLVSEALFRMTYTEHRMVLAKIVESTAPDKFDAIEKIYRGGSITLRSDLIDAVSRLRDDSKAHAFIMDAAQNDKDIVVRRVALEALMSHNAVHDVKVLENLLKAPRTPLTPVPANQKGPGSIPPAPTPPARR